MRRGLGNKAPFSFGVRMAYHQNTIARIKDNPSTELGVRLGKRCVEQEISVVTVAKRFGKSRQAIYNWFFGIHDVEEELHSAVERYLDQL